MHDEIRTKRQDALSSLKRGVESGGIPALEDVKCMVDFLMEVSVYADTLENEASQTFEEDNAIFAATSTLLSCGDVLHDADVLRTIAQRMADNPWAFHGDPERLSISATGGERVNRTLYVSLAVGIICSLFVPTVVQGNRAVTGCSCGKCAESDIVEAGGYDISDRTYPEATLCAHRFAYLHAQKFHPILWRFAHQRGHLGFHDFCKIGAGIAEPSASAYRYLAVWEDELSRCAASALNRLEGTTLPKSVALTGGEMIDESLDGSFIHVSDSAIRPMRIDAAEIRLEADAERHPGEDADTRKYAFNMQVRSELARLLRILDGSQDATAERELVTVNAAIALFASQGISGVACPREAMTRVREAICRGTALDKCRQILPLAEEVASSGT